MFRRSALATLGILVAAAVGAQSLAEVAAREKARRRALGTPPSAVIDEVSLESDRARGATTAPTREAPAEDAPAAAPDRDAPAAAGLSAKEVRAVDRPLSVEEVRDLRDTWARVWADQMASAEDDLAIARDDLRQCRTAELYVFVPLAIDCYGVGERLALAEFRVDYLRMNRFNWELLLEQETRAPPIP